MACRGLLMWFGSLVLIGAAFCGQSGAEDLLTRVRETFYHDCPDNQPAPRTGIAVGHADARHVAEISGPRPPGPCPYFGQAMGATYFNYGYFGARQHFTFSYRVGYYGDYIDRAYSWGY